MQAYIVCLPKQVVSGRVNGDMSTGPPGGLSVPVASMQVWSPKVPGLGLHNGHVEHRLVRGGRSAGVRYTNMDTLDPQL